MHSQRQIARGGLALLLFLLFASEGWGLEQGSPPVEEGACTFEIMAVIPNRGATSTPVTLYGTDFSSKMRLMIDEKRIPLTVIDERTASFAVPALPPGNHTFYLKNGNSCQTPPSTFMITEKSPVITSLVPDRLYYCTPSEDRIVSMQGKNFSKDTKVLFDKIVVGRKFIDEGRLEVKIPQAESGLHFITAINADGTLSLAQNFYIEGRPVIYSISLGLTYDEHYELIVEGENFLWGASPLINGELLGKGVTYQGCNRLIYDRVPVAEEPSEISIQIINPDGEKSASFYLSVP